ncbi:hypothetical protein LMG27952_01070 [Paraburkholderia hiiakae]|uniref:Uncharacterized protein n=1 Tax=Paraburkholderia hiiakae TaxID=1081782 RepID=A0ABM8NDS9_9BURK|nr:hypothetical protein LMG27952_01070 [Paraburkholderia hiiakae]
MEARWSRGRCETPADRVSATRFLYQDVTAWGPINRAYWPAWRSHHGMALQPAAGVEIPSVQIRHLADYAG